MVSSRSRSSRVTRSRCRTERALLGFALVLSLVPPLVVTGCDLDLTLPRPQADQPVEEAEPVDIDDKATKGVKKTPIPGPLSKNGVVELGTAVYPAGASTKGASSYAFVVPPSHRLSYALSKEEQGAIEAYYAAFAKRVKYKKIGKKQFEWIPPSGCSPDMRCIYDALIERTDGDVLVATKRFQKRAQDAKLDSAQLAETMLAFVQSIPYELPNDAFGLKPPPLVLAQKQGDCDSKALLLWMMLREVGIDAVIITSKAHGHTMLGIAIPTNGSSFRHRDRKYFFAETTAKGAPLGFMPPDLTSPNDWKVELATP